MCFTIQIVWSNFRVGLPSLLEVKLSDWPKALQRMGEVVIYGTKAWDLPFSNNLPNTTYGSSIRPQS